MLVGLHLRWNGVWQRPNHIISRIADRVPVVVLEESVADARDHDVVTRVGNVSVVTPHRISTQADVPDDASLRTLRSIVGRQRALIWLYTPMLVGLANAFPDAPVIYDKMDELSKFAHADHRLQAREAEVLRNADLVFTGGKSLFRTVAGRAEAVRCYPSGVDVRHFERARTVAPDAHIRSLARSVYGYVGVIDERLDLELVARLADAYPDAAIAMVGPIAKIAPSALPQRPNLWYAGARRYDELPRILAAFDVALMPFALNEHTWNISPTKTLEYLAAGKPVVSTAIPDVVEDHGDVVHVAADGADFVRLVRQAAGTDPRRSALAQAKTRAAGWDGIVAAMIDDMRQRGVHLGCAAARAAG